MSLTGANAVFMLGITDVFDVPQQLQGYAADDAFAAEPVETTEISMGVDGRMGAGFVFVPYRMRIILQADSDSNDLFDDWDAAQRITRQVFRATGIVIMLDLGKKWTLARGVLSSHIPIPGVKKLLQPRNYAITWESISPALP